MRRVLSIFVLPLVACGSFFVAGCQSGEPEVAEAEAAKPDGQHAQAVPPRLTVQVATPTKRTVQRTVAEAKAHCLPMRRWFCRISRPVMSARFTSILETESRADKHWPKWNAKNSLCRLI